MAAPVIPEITSNVQWISQMNVDIEPTAGRKSSIIGTIGKIVTCLPPPWYLYICVYSFCCMLSTLGPNTNSVEMITQLRNAGLNVVRMNFSHGSYEVSIVLHGHNQKI